MRPIEGYPNYYFDGLHVYKEDKKKDLYVPITMTKAKNKGNSYSAKRYLVLMGTPH